MNGGEESNTGEKKQQKVRKKIKDRKRFKDVNKLNLAGQMVPGYGLSTTKTYKLLQTY